jgi:hypothetical protein
MRGHFPVKANVVARARLPLLCPASIRTLAGLVSTWCMLGYVQVRRCNLIDGLEVPEIVRSRPSTRQPGGLIWLDSNSFRYTKRYVDLTGHPKAVEEDRELPRDGNDGSFAPTLAAD